MQRPPKNQLVPASTSHQAPGMYRVKEESPLWIPREVRCGLSFPCPSTGRTQIALDPNLYCKMLACVYQLLEVGKAPPTLAALQWQVAVVVKITQLPVLTVDQDVHTGSFFNGFYCHFDHPQQYKTMFSPDKNGQLILTCKCTYYT